MVNRPLPAIALLPKTATKIAHIMPYQRRSVRCRTAFAKILGKLYFFKLFDNLRRILLDYGQKRTRRANAAFNASC
jgi:hypothetical protein